MPLTYYDRVVVNESQIHPSYKLDTGFKMVREGINGVSVFKFGYEEAMRIYAYYTRTMSHEVKIVDEFGDEISIWNFEKILSNARYYTPLTPDGASELTIKEAYEKLQEGIKTFNETQEELANETYDSVKI